MDRVKQLAGALKSMIMIVDIKNPSITEPNNLPCCYEHVLRAIDALGSRYCLFAFELDLNY